MLKIKSIKSLHKNVNARFAPITLFQQRNIDTLEVTHNLDMERTMMYAILCEDTVKVMPGKTLEFFLGTHQIIPGCRWLIQVAHESLRTENGGVCQQVVGHLGYIRLLGNGIGNLLPSTPLLLVSAIVDELTIEEITSDPEENESNDDKAPSTDVQSHQPRQ